MDICIVNSLAPLVVPTIAILHCETLFEEKKSQRLISIWPESAIFGWVVRMICSEFRS